MTKMGLEEYKGVYVFAQQVDNELSGIAFELLGKAKELAAALSTDVTAVLIGSVVYKACVAVALKFFEPQDMKLITAVLFLAILLIGMERKKKVKTNA